MKDVNEKYDRITRLLNTVNSEPFAASEAGRWLASRVEFDGRRLVIWFDAYTPQEFKGASLRFRIHHQSDFKYAIRGLHRRGFRNVRLRFVPAEDRKPIPLINSAGDRMMP